MANLTGTRNSVIQFKMPIIIPSQGSDPITFFEANLIQGICQLTDPFERISIGVPVLWIIHRKRDYFTRTVNSVSMLHN
jgi:hypothetical protein